MLKVEPREIGDSLFFRRTAGPGSTARTEPTGQTVVALRHELDRMLVERVRHQQAAKDTEAAIRAAIGAGKDAAQHRQALARLDDAIEALGAEIDHLIGLIEDVRVAAVKHYAAPIARQIEADIAAHIEEFDVTEEMQ